MPSPVGHALGGVIVGAALAAVRQSHATERPRGALAVGPDCAAGVAAAAIAPDLDFLWGRHNMETHSLGAAVLAALAVLLWTRGRGVRLAAIVGLAWASHVLFDWLGSDNTPPLGVMALWPLSNTFYFADAFVFDAISRRTTCRISGRTTCGRWRRRRRCWRRGGGRRVVDEGALTRGRERGAAFRRRKGLTSLGRRTDCGDRACAR